MHNKNITLTRVCMMAHRNKTLNRPRVDCKNCVPLEFCDPNGGAMMAVQNYAVLSLLHLHGGDGDDGEHGGSA